MRRTSALLVALALAALVPGCGSGNPATVADATTTLPDPVDARSPGDPPAPPAAPAAGGTDAGLGRDAAIADPPAPADEPLARELAALRAWPLHDPPALADIDALVRGGIPKPPDPRIVATHAKLMEWGHDAIALAFLLATTDDATAARAFATRLRAVLKRWVEYGTAFGDPKDTEGYGNASLELTWFVSNVARAARILNERAPSLDVGAAATWTAADHAALAAWARAIQTAYLDFPVFSAGLSNRKASQIETMMRIAELDGAKGDARVAALFGALEQLVVDGVTDRGDIPEDSGRDKYHPQFFLASALQALEIGKRHGLLLARADAGTTGKATAHLLAAIRYSADTNADDRAPAEYPNIGNATANHEIPFWILARDLTDAEGVPRAASVDAMVTKGYAKASTFGFVMDWGFNAIAHAKGL